jgi:hypothetical protein
MIDIDKYETKKERNWKLKATYPDRDNSVEAFNGYEDIVAVDSLGRERYTVAQMVDTGLEDAQLIADAPLLLAEVEQLREQNEFLREEVKKDDAGVKAVDALLGGIKNRNEEVKRLREENDELHAQRVQISWIQEARGGQSKAFELLAEVERLREENQRYLDFILWLGIEHKGKKLAWEYGDEKLAEMIE